MFCEIRSVVVFQDGLTTEVKPVEMHHQTLLEAFPGDNVGFDVKNVLGEIGNAYAPVLVCHTSHIAVKLGVLLPEIEKQSEKEIKKNIDVCFITTTSFSEFLPLGYIENMISGTSQADCDVFISDSATGGSESGISNNSEITEHALLALTLGVKHMICCCKKFESTGTTLKYSRGSYMEISKEIASYLKKLGYNPDKTPFVPVSRFESDNMIERSTNLAWYKGLNLLEALHRVGFIETVPVGYIETGVINLGMIVTSGPTGLTTEVKPVEIHHEALLKALPGDSVGFIVKKIVGEIGKAYAPVLVYHTSHIAVKLGVLLSEIEKRSEKEIKKNIDTCFITTTPFSEFLPLFCFAGRDKHQIVALGHCVYMLGGIAKRMLTGVSESFKKEAADMSKRFLKAEREHALLASTLGFKQMICWCNMIESTSTTSKYSKGSYEEISEEVSSYLKKVGYNPNKIPFVPISGLEGDYLINISSCLEALDPISETKGATVKPLCFALQNVFITGWIEAVPVRCVETGEIKSDMVNSEVESEKNTAVKEIKPYHPEKGAANCTSQVIIMNHPGQIWKWLCTCSGMSDFLHCCNK